MDDRSARKRTYTDLETDQSILRYAGKGWRVEAIYKHMRSCDYLVTRQRIMRIFRENGIRLMSKHEEEEYIEIGKGMRRIFRTSEQ